MGYITTTLVSGQNAYVGVVTSRTPQTITVTTGLPGTNGANGTNGTNGTNGANGTNGTNGTNGVSVTAANVASGNLIITFSNSATVDAGSLATNVNGFAIGYRDVPQNFTNTSMTLALTDAGKHILTQNTGSSTQTITIANNATVAFQTGAAITIVVQSTGTVAVANGAGVTMYLTGNSTAKSTVTLNSYSMATLLKIGTDTWIVSGTGAT